MSLPLTPAIISLLAIKTNHRFAHLWRIERTDGKRILLTDHNAPITFKAPGDKLELKYSPIGGFNPTAHQRKAQLNVNNIEFSGALNTAAITDDDLFAKRYRQAKVTQYRVDWQFPFVGFFGRYVFWIGETKFTGEEWQCELNSVARFLESQVGDTYNRDCRYDLGDRNLKNPHVGCAFDLVAELVLDCNVFADSSSHSSFEVANGVIAPQARQQVDGWYDDGFILWTTGLNVNLSSEVRIYDYDNPSTRSTITLQDDTPYDIKEDDLFDIYPGCKKTETVCASVKFDNFINFGGFPYIPGEDHIRKSPGI